MNAEVESRPVIGLTGARFGNVSRRGLDQSLPPVEDPPPTPTPTPDDPIGQTGARFGGAPRRRKLRAAAKAAAAAADAAAALTAIPSQRSAGPVDVPTPRGIPLPFPASAA